eukprot:5263399-Pleurochrysis_carterae.AAC.1
MLCLLRPISSRVLCALILGTMRTRCLTSCVVGRRLEISSWPEATHGRGHRGVLRAESNALPSRRFAVA